VKYRQGLYTKPTSQAIEQAYEEGYDAVFTSPSREVAKKAKELGILYAPVIWVPKANDVKQGVVNAWNETALFAFNNSGCIMNPQLIQNTIQTIEKAIIETGAEAIIIDALRYPSPHDQKWLFTCFCKHCQQHMKTLGINSKELAEKIRQATKNLHQYPHLKPEQYHALQTLTYIKQKAVETALIQIKEHTQKLGTELWAAIFPPSIAWLVGEIIKPLTGLEISIDYKEIRKKGTGPR